MKPTVPRVRMGGKSLTVLRPFFSSALNATEFDKPMVGMKNATDRV